MSAAPDSVVAAARAWLGTPYRHQASLLGSGCDCLGLVRGVWRQLYGAEPATPPAYGREARGDVHAGALEAAAERFLVASPGSLEPGQVLLFALHRGRPPRHCGILVAPDRFIHAQEQLGVVEASLSTAWRRRIAAQFAFP